MRKLFCLLLGLVLVSNAWAADQKLYVTGDDAKMNKFISGLMAKMTVQEKAGQLAQYTGEMAVTGNTLKNFEEDLKKGLVGSFLNIRGAQMTREIQQRALEHSRLKIPLLFGFDVIHGYKTMFPIPLGESASWDLNLMEKSARIAAAEASADGLHWTFAPMVDVSRDPRWGRVAEGAGEDPWLGAKVATARVRGFQGSSARATDTVFACVKHFALYGAPEAGRDYNVVTMNEREMFENYMPPYEAAVKAGAQTVMTSFNEVNGVPATGNSWLMNDLLRKKWGFKGLIVTDYTAITEMIKHGVAANEPQAGLLAMKAGVDMDMMGSIYSKFLPEQVKKGQITTAQLDAAVRRVLETKYKRGLFEDPYRFSDVERAKSTLLAKEHLEHARQVARASMVLLKNDKGVLPLKRGSTIALVGPFVENRFDQVGNWPGAGEAKDVTPILDGMNAAAGEKTKIIYAKGSNLIDDPNLINFLRTHYADIPIDKKSPEDLIKDAVRAAKKADVVVAAVGEAREMSGEGASRTKIRLPENQLALIKALKETGKPLVLVVHAGRPLVLEQEMQLADGIVMAWFLGSQAGPAVADVLFGDYNPSGKLTMSFPRTEGQIPVYYSEKPTGRPIDPKDKPTQKYVSRYIDSPNDPLFPFGYGLSYTTFAISAPKLATAKVKSGQKISVTVNVKNTGGRDGEEVVQLYVRDMVGSVTRPLKSLRGFEKVALKAGEAKDITFTLTTEDLKFYDKNMKWVVEPGQFQVMVGANSRDVQGADFTLL